MKRCLLISALMAYSLTPSLAQYQTGDAQLNASLVLIDGDASTNIAVFKTDMNATYGVAPAKIDTWTISFGLKGGDIYLILEMGRILNKPVDDVAKVYNSNKKKGWGAIAKELGIKPGSAEFKALKAGADKHASKGKGNSKDTKAKGKK